MVNKTIDLSLVKARALNLQKPVKSKRFGFMAGKMTVPDDFDRMGEEDIAELFENNNKVDRITAPA